MGILKSRTATFNQHGEKVLEMVSIIMIRTREAAGQAG